MTDAKYRTILKRFLPVGVNPEPFWYPKSGAIHRSPVRFRNPQPFTVWLLLHCCRANYSRNVKIIHNCITKGRVSDDGRPSPKFLTPSADHLRPRPATTTWPRSQQSSASSNDGANSTKLRDVVDFWQRFKTFTSRRSFAQKQGRAQSSENRWNHGLSGNAPQTGFRRGFDRSTDRPRKRPSSRPSFFCSFFFLPSRLLLLLLLPSASRCWVTHYKVLLARASQPDGRRHGTPYLSSSNYSPESELQGVL